MNVMMFSQHNSPRYQCFSHVISRCLLIFVDACANRFGENFYFFLVQRVRRIVFDCGRFIEVRLKTLYVVFHRGSNCGYGRLVVALVGHSSLNIGNPVCGFGLRKFNDVAHIFISCWLDRLCQLKRILGIRKAVVHAVLLLVPFQSNWVSL